MSIMLMPALTFIRSSCECHLGLFHTHLAFVPVAVETSSDLPHSLTGTEALHEVGREQTHLVSALPLVTQVKTQVKTQVIDEPLQ